MKHNFWNLITAVLNWMAFVCFTIAAAAPSSQTAAAPKYLFAFSALCFFISSTGFFYTYGKNKKKEPEV